MDRLKTKTLENELRMGASRFINDTLMRCSSAPIIEKIKQEQWLAFLCGGSVRDLLLMGKESCPRDVDIIVHYVNRDDLIRAFRQFSLRENRFGGLSIEINDWKVDIWPLATTWAFQNKVVKYDSSFSSYPKTTFLNIEAIAVEMFAKRGRKRKIYSNGFFEAIQNRTLEINLEPNPDYEVNIARSVYMSLKYDFSLGPKLRKYIVNHVDRIDMGRLLHIYKNSYLRPNWNRGFLESVFEKIKQQGMPLNSNSETDNKFSKRGVYLNLF